MTDFQTLVGFVAAMTLAAEFARIFDDMGDM